MCTIYIFRYYSNLWSILLNPTFNIAIFTSDQEILISLEQDGPSKQKIRLDGIAYAYRYTGDDTHRASIVQKLEETFADNTPVTKATLQHCLESFGNVEITTSLEKLQRAIERASVLGRGMNKMSGRREDDEARGRMMAENVYINLYMELRTKQDDEIFTKQKELLFRWWKADKKTNLSLPEWESYKQKQWQQLKSERTFVSWLCHQAWENSVPKEDKLTWFLRQDHKQFKISMPFDEWKKIVIADITKGYGQYLNKSATQEEILQSWLEKMTSGLNMSDSEFIVFEQWQKNKTLSSFEDELIRTEWERSDKSQSLSEYRLSKIQELEERWEKTGLKQAGMDFATWRKMQDPSLHSDSGLRAFIHCDAEQRRLFQLGTSSSGAIQRNQQLYSTEYETTLHSGKGYAIFVVGPDEEIYAGSHIQQVFHHSSFLANEATLAAGELRMGLDCVIQKAKDKQQAQALLKEFTTNNKDPYKIQFIKNEKDKTWVIAGENDAGTMQMIAVPPGSELDQALQDPTMNNLSFSKRSTILRLAAISLGKTNPTHEVTLLSSKSGHYQPQDEENYYMLHLWAKRGVDLTKTPFISLSSSQMFRSAKEYLDQIEPRMRARQQTRLFIELGSMQNNLHEPVSSIEKSVVINKQGECYEGGLSHSAFTHPDLILAKQLPGFREGSLILKRDVTLKIEKLKANIDRATAHIAELDKLIKQTTPRMRASRTGRLTVKENEQSRIDKMARDLVALEKAMVAHPEPGKQEIKGGGIMTLNAAGEVIKVDAKLEHLTLSPAEIENTLLTLKRRGVNLENVTLVHYDQAGKAKPQNANQYLVEKYQATQVKSTTSGDLTTHEAASFDPPSSLMARYKATVHAQQPEQPCTDSDEDKVLPSSLSKPI